MTFQPLSEQSLGDRVAEQLREAIFTGRLAPGARLVEQRLADELGVSHIPVREALGQLANEGLIERLPRRGSRVTVLTHRDVEEISSLRAVLEQLVAVRVQERLTEASELELRQIVDTMTCAAEAGDTRHVFVADGRFHELLWQLSDHRLLIEFVAQLRSRINAFLRAANIALEPDALMAHARMHENLLLAICSGDSEAAKAATVEHISIATQRLRESYSAEGSWEPAKAAPKRHTSVADERLGDLRHDDGKPATP